MYNTPESIKNALAQLGIDTSKVQVTINNSDLAPANERAVLQKRNEDLVEEEINKSEELKEIFSYLKENYDKLYKIAFNIFPYIKKGSATEKQIKLYTKIISIDWNKVNVYVNAIRKNPEKCTNGYYREICENIINNIPNYGISMKQLNVLQRSYNLPK